MKKSSKRYLKKKKKRERNEKKLKKKFWKKESTLYPCHEHGLLPEKKEPREQCALLRVLFEDT